MKKPGMNSEEETLNTITTVNNDENIGRSDK